MGSMTRKFKRNQVKNQTFGTGSVSERAFLMVSAKRNDRISLDIKMMRKLIALEETTTDKFIKALLYHNWF